MSWVSYTVFLPPGNEDEEKILRDVLKGLGFKEDDWCAMTRHDGAAVSWGPMPTPPWAVAILPLEPDETTAD